MLLSRFRIKGHSMEPAIRNGQTVLVSKIPYVISYPKVGDIVLFKHKQIKFVKRIKKIKKNKFYLTGDNEKDSLDSRKLGWVERKQILGKVL